ncbi:class F sortase [Subtercola vilae]|uniref:Glucanase n=1 Tax=Subtercola vilae TaxID=2056433 RepID=A0A4T2C9Y9_9MICO|nr:class F sortase [Subtercola vilae]TIH39318.1 sortase [Subtercola vilae]
MMRRTPAAVLGAVAVAVGLTLAGCTAAPAPAPTTTAAPTGVAGANQVATRFLTEYVDSGRVVRRDQGSDTVSEGQAYGMLLAVGVNDKATFDSIWSWTQTNLQRPDGLMAWNWKDGKVVDSEPASDADLDMARALVEAGTKFSDPALIASGDKLGGLILDKLTVTTATGRILLPGLWAAASSPYAYNPSYASPAAFSELGASSGDPRWAELSAGSRAVTTTLLTKSALPPDWAQVHADGTVDQMPAPRGDSSANTVEYSYDAARLPIRYAESCDPADTALAAKLVSTLSRSDPLKAQLDLGGTATTTDTNPVSYAARAAAYAAAAQPDKSDADLATADTLDQTTPTYYGAAWTALSMQLLETANLGSCPPLASASGGVGANQDPQATSVSSTSSKKAEGLTPVRVQIPDIGVDSGLESLTRDQTGAILPPTDFASAGWYKDGVVPGDTGPAVIAGHIDSAIGPAVFYTLSSLKPGAKVTVTLSDASTVTYTVNSELQAPKQQFPTDQVYGPTPDAQLRLITCGGVFDDSYGHYLDNVVVFATKTSA